MSPRRRNFSISPAALRSSEELVRTIAENSTQGLAMMDAQGYCTYANRAWLDMTGYTAEEIIGRQNPGQTILDTINLVPGVSFQNNDAYGSSGGTTWLNPTITLLDPGAQAYVFTFG